MQSTSRKFAYVKYGLLGAALCALSARADNPLMNDNGVGTKALSMGNSFVAVADDFSAVYWNPAGLAFLPVRGLQFSLDALQDGTEAALNGTFTDASQQRLRIGHVGLVRSIPTRQGGFGFAIGLIRPVIFDNVYNIRGTDTYRGNDTLWGSYYSTVGGDTVQDHITNGEQLTYRQGEKHVSGQLNMLTFSAGWQIAPALGVGVTVAPMFGREYQINSYETSEGSALFEYSTEKSRRLYYGLDVRGGILFAPGERLRLGMRLQLPQFGSIVQNFSFRDRYYTNYVQEYNDEKGTFSTSLSGALGMSYRLPFMLLSCEASGRSPFPEAEVDMPRSLWRGGASAGVEIPLPKLSTVLRAGYSWKQLDMYHYKIEWAGETTPFEPDFHTGENRQMVTAGFAFMLKDYAVIEAAYAYSLWEYAFDDIGWSPITEAHDGHRVQLSFSLRY